MQTSVSNWVAFAPEVTEKKAVLPGKREGQSHLLCGEGVGCSVPPGEWENVRPTAGSFAGCQQESQTGTG